MMTLSIGNSRKRPARSKSGFTFLEVMVTVVILSTGIVMIYKAYLISLDQQRYLIHRLYANNLLDQKIADVRQLFEENQEARLLKEDQSAENIMIYNKNIPFEIRMAFQDIPALQDILQLNISVAWPEQGRQVRLARSAYISRP